MISTWYLRTYARIRNFCSKIVSKKFLTFIFFLFLSGVFWLMITLNETYENEYEVPLTLINIPNNAVITDNLTDTVTIFVRDKGFNLLAYEISHKIKPITINFNDFANGVTGHGVIPASYIQKHIIKQLYGSSRITNLSPNTVEFFFNYGRSKKVPVHLNGKINPSRSYYLLGTSFSPDSVLVYADKQTLDNIKYINTIYQNEVNFQDTIIRQVPLQKIRRVKTVPSVVRMTLYADMLIEESMEVPITATNVPTDKILRMFPSKVKINFVVGASKFKSIKPEQFTVIADYNSLQTNMSDKCTLFLRGNPQGVSNIKLAITSVDYLIEQQ